MQGLTILFLVLQIGIPVLFAIGGGVALLIFLCCRHKGPFGRISPSADTTVVYLNNETVPAGPSSDETISLLSPTPATTYTTAPGSAAPQPVYYIPTAQYEPYQQTTQQY